jgi:hypothetical protein
MSELKINPVTTISIRNNEGAIVELLRELQLAILVHPEAARALMAAFTREGRAFAQTPEGAETKERLRRSELVHRALLVWQTSTMWMTEEGASAGATPSALVDAIASAARAPGRDKLLDQLFREADES